MEQMTSLMRSIMDFYYNQKAENPIVLERMKEGSSEEWVLGRLERAIFNDCDTGSVATHSRYAIWGEDIRSLVLMARDEMKKENYGHAEELLNNVINSMGAYVDAQVILSSKPENINFVNPVKILETYIASLKQNGAKDTADIDYIIKGMQENIMAIEAGDLKNEGNEDI